MNDNDIRLLARALTAHAPERTILVTASRAEGRRLLSSVAGTGCVLLGTKAETPFTLARELCALSLSRPGMPRLMEEMEAAEVLRGCMDRGLYNTVNARSLSATRAFYRTFQEMAMAGLGEEAENTAAVQESLKLRELLALRRAYQEKKAALGLMDRADLFRLALEMNEDHPLYRAHYVVLGDYAPAPLERKLLEKLAGRTGLCTVALPCADGLPLPQGAMADDLPRRNAVQVLREGESRFVACRGVETEVRFPLRDILTQKRPVEECAIVCLSGNYAQSLYEEAGRFSLPVTVGGGLPLTGSQLYTTLRSVRALPVSQFHAEEVCTLLENGGLTPPEAGTLLRRLRKKKVGWGRERYGLVMQEDDRPDNLEETAWQDVLIRWRRFFALLFAVAAPTGDLAAQRRDLGDFLAFCGCRSAGEAAANAKAAELAAGIVGLEEHETALDRLLTLMETSTYLGGSPEPGKLYIAPLSQAAALDRKHLYVLGFSRYAVQGIRRASPILQDEEREALGGLKTSAQQGREQEFRLLTLLVRHGGTFTLTYPDFDSTSMLPLEMAPFFREASGGTVEHVTYFPQRPLTVTEESLTHQAVTILPPLGVDTAGAAPASLQSSKSRKEQMLAMDFSATMLEEAARCPYAFYLRRLLKLRAPQTVDRREDTWLTAADIGTFCHGVLAEYYSNPTGNWQEVFEREFPKLRELVPMPRPELEAEEKEGLRKILERAIEWTANEERNVLATEEAFQGQVLSFDNGWKLKLQGSIDRVDELRDGCIAILDYKTGDPQKLTREKDRHWQHYLYTLVEEALHPDRQVGQADYLFLQEQAEALTMEETAQQRELYRSRITWLLDQVADERRTPACVPSYEVDKNHPDVLTTGLAGKRGEERKACAAWCEFADVCPEQKGGKFQ